jgi:hypothetical protein
MHETWLSQVPLTLGMQMRHKCVDFWVKELDFTVSVHILESGAEKV